MSKPRAAHMLALAGRARLAIIPRRRTHFYVLLIVGVTSGNPCASLTSCGRSGAACRMPQPFARFSPIRARIFPITKPSEPKPSLKLGAHQR